MGLSTCMRAMSEGTIRHPIPTLLDDLWAFSPFLHGSMVVKLSMPERFQQGAVKFLSQKFLHASESDYGVGVGVSDGSGGGYPCGNVNLLHLRYRLFPRSEHQAKA